jgi:hypothetical protein
MRIAIGCLVVVVVFAPVMSRADCEDVIRLSRTTMSVVQDSTQVSQYARDFCSNYASSSGASSSTAFGVAYKFLSASLSTSDASYQEVASRYCDAAKSSQAKSDAYRQYVESIAPGAYDSYNRCVDMERTDKVFVNVDGANVLPKSFKVNVTYQTRDGQGSQTLAFSTSPDVTCRWARAPSSDTTTLPVNNSDTLSCQRTTAASRSSVMVWATRRSNSHVSFAWDSMDAAGVPTNLAGALRSEVMAAKKEVASLRSQVVALGVSTACEKFEATSDRRQYASIQVQIPPDRINEGWVRTGGGCSSQTGEEAQVPGGHNPILLRSKPEGDDGWRCMIGDQKSTPTPAAVTAYILACKSTVR